MSNTIKSEIKAAACISFAILSAAYIRERLINESGLYWADFNSFIHFDWILAMHSNIFPIFDSFFTNWIPCFDSNIKKVIFRHRPHVPFFCVCVCAIFKPITDNRERLILYEFGNLVRLIIGSGFNFGAAFISDFTVYVELI